MAAYYTHYFTHFRRSEPVNNGAEIVQGDVLVVAQLLGRGVPDQGELVGVGAGDALHERREGVPAGMRRQAMAADLVYGILDPEALQQIIELVAVIRETELNAGIAEDVSAAGFRDQTVNDRLDLRRDGHGSPLPCRGLDTADKAASLRIIVRSGELQQRGRTKPKVTMASCISRPKLPTN